MSDNMISGPRLETARYGAVILIGFGFDFGITLALSRRLGLPLELSAAIGFLSALALNYILFEFWVFRGEDSAFSATRLSQTGLACRRGPESARGPLSGKSSARPFPRWWGPFSWGLRRPCW
jgi:hypothetical protein